MPSFNSVAWEMTCIPTLLEVSTWMSMVRVILSDADRAVQAPEPATEAALWDMATCVPCIDAIMEYSGLPSMSLY